MLPIRKTVRLILINKNSHVLMIRIIEPPKQGINKRPYWITPGGAIEQNETEEDAIWRELLEETAIRRDQARIIGLIGKSQHELEWGGILSLFKESFYFIKTNHLNVNSNNATSAEKKVFNAQRWWSVDELSESNEIFFPINLKDIVKCCIKDEEQAPSVIINTTTPPNLFITN